MTSETIDEKTQSVISVNGTAQITIPKDWRGMIGLLKDGEVVDEATVALMRGKHGFFIAIYNKENQQK